MKLHQAGASEQTILKVFGKSAPEQTPEQRREYCRKYVQSHTKRGVCETPGCGNEIALGKWRKSKLCMSCGQKARRAQEGRFGAAVLKRRRVMA